MTARPLDFVGLSGRAKFLNFAHLSAPPRWRKVPSYGRQRAKDKPKGHLEMPQVPKHEKAEDKFTIELSYRWSTHLGYDRGSVDTLQMMKSDDERIECLTLLRNFKTISDELNSECRHEESTREVRGQNHFDGGVSFRHAASMLAVCAGAVPLSVIIKATRDIIVKLIEKKLGHIEVTLGAGRKIIVGDTKKLDEVLTRLENSTLTKSSPMSSTKMDRPLTSKPRVSKAKAKAKPEPRQNS